ncbi:hypothetical protein ACP70R_013123 [Stipagrostis hirtigluma subsp. patula]
MACRLRLLCRAGRLLLYPGPRRGFSAFARELLHVCVVDSGPAGFYTAVRVAFTGCSVGGVSRSSGNKGCISVVIAYVAESDRSLGIPGEAAVWNRRD